MLGDTAGRIPGRLWSAITMEFKEANRKDSPAAAPGGPRSGSRLGWSLDATPTILGTVFQDLNDDGVPSAGEGPELASPYSCIEDRRRTGLFQVDREDLLMEHDRLSSDGAVSFSTT